MEEENLINKKIGITTPNESFRSENFGKKIFGIASDSAEFDDEIKKHLLKANEGSYESKSKLLAYYMGEAQELIENWSIYIFRKDELLNIAFTEIIRFIATYNENDYENVDINKYISEFIKTKIKITSSEHVTENKLRSSTGEYFDNLVVYMKNNSNRINTLLFQFNMYFSNILSKDEFVMLALYYNLYGGENSPEYLSGVLQALSDEKKQMVNNLLRGKYSEKELGSAIKRVKSELKGSHKCKKYLSSQDNASKETLGEMLKSVGLTLSEKEYIYLINKKYTKEETANFIVNIKVKVEKHLKLSEDDDYARILKQK